MMSREALAPRFAKLIANYLFSVCSRWLLLLLERRDNLCACFSLISFFRSIVKRRASWRKNKLGFHLPHFTTPASNSKGKPRTMLDETKRKRNSPRKQGNGTTAEIAGATSERRVKLKVNTNRPTDRPGGRAGQATLLITQFSTLHAKLN